MDSTVMLAVLSGFLGSIAFLVAVGQRSSLRAVSSSHCEPAASNAFSPYSRRNVFFSSAERSLYEILRRITPEHTVFAKVKLAELVDVTGTVSRQTHLKRIDGKHIDFVVCDKNLAPVVAIELDDAASDRTNSSGRDELVEEVLAAAALPVIHVRAGRGCVLDEIHRLLRPYLRIGTLTL